MRTRLKSRRGSIRSTPWRGATAAVLVAVGAVWLLPAAAAGQTPDGYVAPRLQGTSNPDMNGIWQAFTTANWNLEAHGAEAGPSATPKPQGSPQQQLR